MIAERINTTMKKTILALFLSALLCFGLLTAASAEETPGIDIIGHNLALKDSVNLVYYLDESRVPEGAEIGLLLWKTPQAADGYTYDNREYLLPHSDELFEYEGITYHTYRFTGLSAKEMTVDVYAVAYYQADGSYTYSKPDKYSVLQYAYRMKDSTLTTDTGSLRLGELLTQMLDYGAAAQQYFGVNPDRLANDDYYQVNVVGGVLPDGMTSGLYPAGTELMLTTALSDAEWTGPDAGTLGSGSTLTVTVPASDIVYTASESAAPETPAPEIIGHGIAGDNVTWQLDSEYLLTISGTGAITNPEWNNSDYIYHAVIESGVTNICEAAFAGCPNLTSVVIPNTVTSIDASAFDGCTGLTAITIPASVGYIGDDAFYDCSNLAIVNFGGSEADWAAITGYGKEDLDGISVVFNYQP